jgi:hypothetical protein
MWNRIKNAPYIGVSQSGHVSWIAGGYQNQLGVESQIVGVTCKFVGRRLRKRPCGVTKKQESRLTNRRLARILHHRSNSIRTLSNIRYKTTSRRLPMARGPHFRLLLLVQVVQDEEWVVPIRTLVLGKRR